jgi:hypothetical protein
MVQGPSFAFQHAIACSRASFCGDPSLKEVRAACCLRSLRSASPPPCLLRQPTSSAVQSVQPSAALPLPHASYLKAPCSFFASSAVRGGGGGSADRPWTCVSLLLQNAQSPKPIGLHPHISCRPFGGSFGPGACVFREIPPALDLPLPPSLLPPPPPSLPPLLRRDSATGPHASLWECPGLPPCSTGDPPPGSPYRS